MKPVARDSNANALAAAFFAQLPPEGTRLQTLHQLDLTIRLSQTKRGIVLNC
jgi:hypothetical protein